MKKRTEGFLSEENISHESEIFDYVSELHGYLWRFVRAGLPWASGNLEFYLDAAINSLEAAQQSVQRIGLLRADQECPHCHGIGWHLSTCQVANR